MSTSRYEDFALTTQVADPTFDDCDLRLTGMKVTDLRYEGQRIAFRLTPGKGYMKTAEGLQRFGEVRLNNEIVLDFLRQQGDPAENFDKQLENVAGVLRTWQEAGTELRLFAAPDKWTRLMATADDWLPLPRDARDTAFYTH